MTVSLWLRTCPVRHACRVKCDTDLHPVKFITLPGIAPFLFLFARVHVPAWRNDLCSSSVAAGTLFRIAHGTALRRIDESMLLLRISLSVWLPRSCGFFLFWECGSGSVGGILYCPAVAFRRLKLKDVWVTKVLPRNKRRQRQWLQWSPACSLTIRLKASICVLV